MDDIRRQDLRLFASEASHPMRLLLVAASIAFLFLRVDGLPIFSWTLLAALTVIGGVVWSAWSASERRRFSNQRLHALWRGCDDRLARFEEALKRMRADQRTELHEMPKTIRMVAQNLYVALRRADMIATEIQASERGLYSQPPVWTAQPGDPQSKELYRLADKNIAEYRTRFAGVMAGVERAEAQCAVFMTTLDSLRMRMLGYRLVGKSPELNSEEFLTSLAEARAQFQAIDTALEELDLGHYPKMIAAVPPPVPAEARDQDVRG